MQVQSGLFLSADIGRRVWMYRKYILRADYYEALFFCDYRVVLY